MGQKKCRTNKPGGSGPKAGSENREPHLVLKTLDNGHMDAIPKLI